MNPPAAALPPTPVLAFIGGGNMASAIVSGLVGDGRAPDAILVVEPGAPARARLERDFGVRTLAEAGAPLAQAGLVVWAVKPQVFEAAAAPCAAFIGGALQLSIMAGVRIETIARVTGSQRIVRAMPNTPALVGHGIAGLCASPAVGAADRTATEATLAPTGELLWLDREEQLDAVTALSGSGPAYVFYFLEAMVEAARRLGFDEAQGRRLALATFAGSTALAAASGEGLAELRRRVTSPGGTTEAAIAVLSARDTGGALIAAIQVAHQRAIELGGAPSVSER